MLILDEPTSSLDEDEVQALFARHAPAARRGHGDPLRHAFLDQVYAICDRITVLRNGELRRRVPAARAAAARRWSRAMVGRELSAAAGARRTQPARPASRRRRCSRRAAWRGAASCKPIDLELRPARSSGSAGLLGSGRTELARLLFGARRAATAASCASTASRRSSTARRTRSATASAFCPEDRKHDGIVAELSVRENIVLALQARHGPAELPVARRAAARSPSSFVAALGIKTAEHRDADRRSSRAATSRRRVLARWLATDPRVLILDEPTRGIDVAAKQEIMDEILALARGGMAVLFISSEMDEVVRVSRSHRRAARPRARSASCRGGSSEQAVYHLIAAGH